MRPERRWICLYPGMVSRGRFTALDGPQQLDVLGDVGVFIAEKARQGAYSLYYMVNGFFVEVRLQRIPVMSASLCSFTDRDPLFGEMLDALPVDPAALVG